MISGDLTSTLLDNGFKLYKRDENKIVVEGRMDYYMSIVYRLVADMESEGYRWHSVECKNTGNGLLFIFERV